MATRSENYALRLSVVVFVGFRLLESSLRNCIEVVQMNLIPLREPILFNVGVGEFEFLEQPQDIHSLM